MSDPQLTQLNARVESLERQARRFKRITTVTALACLALGALGMSAASRSVSTPMTIADAAGHRRTALEPDGLRVYDSHGRLRLFAGLNEHAEPAIHLIDAHGTTRETIYLDPHFEQPTIKFVDTHRDERADYFLGDRDGSPRIELAAANGNDRFYLSASNRPYLAFGDDAIAQRAYFGLSAAGDGLLRMRTHTGGEAVSIEGYATTPFIRLLSAGSVQRVYLGVYQNGVAGMELLDAHGRQLWSTSTP